MEDRKFVEKSISYILRRVFAFVIDGLLFFPLYGFFALVIFTTPVPEEERLTSFVLVMISLIAINVLILIYFVYLEYQNGKTFGKWIFKLKVVSVSDNKTLLQFVVRNLLIPIDILLGLFFIIFDKNSRRVGDLAAGTVVIPG